MKIATFNIRYGTADDGPNRWAARRSILFETIGRLGADILCVQECQPFQGDEIVLEFPHLGRFGLGRYHGIPVNRAHEAYSGEHCDILVDTRRYSVERSGTFWHSDTPEVAGSITWGNSLARITTWAILVSATEPARERFAVFNTHFHTGNEYNEYAAKTVDLITAKMRGIAGGLPHILLGDFNSAPGSEVHRRFTAREAGGDGGDSKSRPSEGGGAVEAVRQGARLIDAWVALGKSEDEAGTGHGFTGIPNTRIDWILPGDGFTPVSIEASHFQKDGSYPSDHFPVVAELRISD